MPENKTGCLNTGKIRLTAFCFYFIFAIIISELFFLIRVIKALFSESFLFLFYHLLFQVDEFIQLKKSITMSFLRQLQGTSNPSTGYSFPDNFFSGKYEL